MLTLEKSIPNCVDVWQVICCQIGNKKQTGSTQSLRQLHTRWIKVMSNGNVRQLEMEANYRKVKPFE